MVDNAEVKVERSRVFNHDGWWLPMRRTTAGPPVAGRRPVLIVPGYGMNSFIFGFHPRGLSLEGYLATQGYEVWSSDLRGMSAAECVGTRRPYGLADLALVDLRAVIGSVLGQTTTGATQVDVVGASLGAALMFIEAALGRDERMASLVSLGGPLRWERVHPLLGFAFGSPAFAGWLRFKGTRRLAGVALPLLARMPWLLSIYMNASITDLSRGAEMVQTVEDPVPQINREIAEWLKSRDLFVQGANLTEAVGRLQNRLLSVVAHGDGIVPRETALSAHHAIGSTDREILEVGDDRLHIAHADLFVSDIAEAQVFTPLARWLAAG